MKLLSEGKAKRSYATEPTGEPMDQGPFRRDLAKVMENHAEVLKRAHDAVHS